MPTKTVQQRFHVWGRDNVSYGPVELPLLTHWVLEERVVASDWVFDEGQRTWMRADQIREVQDVFTRGDTQFLPRPDGFPIKPGSLRRIKIFADMQESQLEVFVRYMEVCSYKQFATVVSRGDHGEAMYLVLEGELRARNIIGGKETTLSTMGPGDFFGEISILDHGPRSADVVANKESLLLKISAAAIANIVRESPTAAAPFLFGLSRSVAGRLRNITKRYEDSIHFSRTAGLNA